MAYLLVSPSRTPSTQGSLNNKAASLSVRGLSCVKVSVVPDGIGSHSTTASFRRGQSRTAETMCFGIHLNLSWIQGTIFNSREKTYNDKSPTHADRDNLALIHRAWHSSRMHGDNHTQCTTGARKEMTREGCEVYVSKINGHRPFEESCLKEEHIDCLGFSVGQRTQK